MFDDLDAIGGCVSLGVSFEAALMQILPISASTSIFPMHLWPVRQYPTNGSIFLSYI